jgi:mRNA interferase MazF
MRCGEIWMLDLNPTRGDEIQKTRPAVIVNDDLVGTLALKIIVPITDWKDHYAKVDWMARLEPNQENGLIKISAADAFQVRSVSQTRFVRRLGTVSEVDFRAIKKAIAFVFDLEVPTNE